jgi:hypothetical protein
MSFFLPPVAAQRPLGRPHLLLDRARSDDASKGGHCMNIESEVRNFVDLSSIDKSRFLARFMYELTLEARNYYAPGGNQDIDANKLRFINEIQHRVTRFIEQVLIDDPARPTDDLMLRLLLAPRSEKSIETLVQSAYTRTIQAVG